MTADLSGVPLTPGVARHIIEEIFQRQSQWKRADLVAEVQRVHSERGGLAGQQNPFAVVKKALSNLQDDGLVEKHHYGHWKWISTPKESAGQDSTVDGPVESPDYDADNDAQVGEKVLGSGPESVYLYFNPNDRKLAELEGRSLWECKIGRSSMADSAVRIHSQGAKTALSHEPVVGLVIRTMDSSALEKALHAALRLVDAQVPDSPGVEWFLTSPQQVESWYRSFEQSLRILKR